MRPIPKTYTYHKSVYITTIVGEGGRPSDLELELKLRYIEGDREVQRVVQKIPAIIIPVSMDPPEFDIYKKISSGPTNTASFRESLGWLLTTLMQCGYTASHVDKSKELPQYPNPEKANLDF